MALELLKAAANSGPPSESQALVPGILRFSLEYRNAPVVARERGSIAQLLGGEGFSLFPLPSGEDPNILILQFQHIEREQSPSFLFKTAAELAEALELVSCVPDVDPGWRAEDEMGRVAPESIGGIVWALCKSDASPPHDPQWAVRLIRADAAWKKYATKGEGIRIGQPDTGVADHRELDGALDLAAGVDVILGAGPPTDPLSPSMSSPGHGTATSSAVASRAPGRMVGSAPGATVIPIRCVNNVVLSGGAAVAAAIDHARTRSCDVVTMSLGGPIQFADLERAIHRAVEAGMIVLAAAGNCVGWVVYPAWDSNVIAVAAIDAHGHRWRGSSYGPKIDVAAPGESVYVARRSAHDDLDKTLVEPGQGTSFAVALTAGCAALWLAHHTRKAVRKEAARRGVSVQALFRAALRQTAHANADWNHEELGAGIVDAERLLSLPLKQIRVESAPISAHPMAEPLGAGFDWSRHASEAGYLAFQAKQRNDPARALAAESPIAPRPSPALTAAVLAAGKTPETLFGAPAIVSSPITPEIGPARALTLIVNKFGTTESSAVVNESTARMYYRGEGRRQVLELLDRVLAEKPERASQDPHAAQLRASVRNAAEEVVDGLAKDAHSSADFTGVARLAAEALVRLVGRPALRIVGDEVDKNDPQIGQWAGELLLPRRLLKPVIAATGRIDMEIDGRWVHVGTGTVVGNGLVMTNRHVIDAFAEPIPMPGGKRDFLLSARISIIFDEKAKNEECRFVLKRVAAAGPSRIGLHADIAKLDMALIESETTNAAGKALPAAVAVGDLPNPDDGPGNVAIVGYPAKPSLDALVDPETGKVSDAIGDRLWELYQNDYGHKYLSPGEIGLGLGALAGDQRRWAFSHDATTLAGNSGSCAIALGSTFNVCGLHFGGAPMRQNLAHGLSAVRAIAASDPAIFDPAVLDLLNWSRG
ncbi:MAG: S8/S53 family peptidase [Hyphomicrobiales bacterium]|nr:S8/S53 family peptidase [Hyphomicrobiales bacterium]